MRAVDQAKSHDSAPGADSFGEDMSSGPTPLAQQQSQMTALQVLREVVETAVLTLLIFLVIRNVVQNFRVEGSSMEPNFHDRQFLIVNRFSYCPGFHLDIPFTDISWQKVWCLWEPQRGDVIVFHAPDQDKDYIKRVIALPGESVEVSSGQVLVDGRVLEEPYETRRITRDQDPFTVGPNQVFVMGDNRPNSRDSRTWGALSMDAIVGKALLSYWPPSAWSVVTHYSFAGILQ